MSKSDKSPVINQHNWHITTLCNQRGMRVTLADHGATWLSAQVPLADGSIRETLLGCATTTDYLQQTAFLGATVGRYANRICNATLNQQHISLAANQGRHQLHGGPEGFDKRRWQIISQNDSYIRYQLDSPDGDQGFPGHLSVSVCYHLDDHHCLTITSQVTTDRPCPVNLTSHAYFNLDLVHQDARQHYLQLHASHYLPVDSEGIPSGPPKSVADTGFDFHRPKMIATDFLQDSDQRLVRGYDHGFLLETCGDISQPAAHLWSADRQLQLDVYTTAPALQVYTGNNLAGTPSRGSEHYTDFQGIALESGFLADSPNHPEWPQPDCWLSPGKVYTSVTKYAFKTA